MYNFCVGVNVEVFSTISNFQKIYIFIFVPPPQIVLSLFALCHHRTSIQRKYQETQGVRIFLLHPPDGTQLFSPVCQSFPWVIKKTKGDYLTIGAIRVNICAHFQEGELCEELGTTTRNVSAILLHKRWIMIQTADQNTIQWFHMVT